MSAREYIERPEGTGSSGLAECHLSPGGAAPSCRRARRDLCGGASHPSPSAPWAPAGLCRPSARLSPCGPAWGPCRRRCAPSWGAPPLAHPPATTEQWLAALALRMCAASTIAVINWSTSVW